MKNAMVKRYLMESRGLNTKPASISLSNDHADVSTRIDNGAYELIIDTGSDSATTNNLGKKVKYMKLIDHMWSILKKHVFVKSY